MIDYMRFCQKYQLHLVSDEIYALTTFPTDDIPNPTPFTSLLSIPKDDTIDPSLCHVLHGMSKVRPYQFTSNTRISVGTEFGLGCLYRKQIQTSSQPSMASGTLLGLPL